MKLTVNNVPKIFARSITGAFWRFINEDYLNWAATLAYTSILSFLPMLLVIFSVLTRIPQLHQYAHKIEHFIFNNLVASSAHNVVNYFDVFVERVNNLSWWSLLFLLVLAVWMLMNMRSAFNHIWRTSGFKKRRWYRLLLTDLGVILLLPILVGVGILFGSHLLQLSVNHFLTSRYQWLQYMIFALANGVIFIVLGWTLPSARIPRWAIIIGGIFTMLVFELGKMLFSLYVIKVNSYQVLYGALAVVPIFLVWVYIAWVIILFGGLFTRELVGQVRKI